MPTIKTVREMIYFQYAKIISKAQTGGKTNYATVTIKWKQLLNGEIKWSSSVREWLKEKENPTHCIYCSEEKELTVEHILPRHCGGEDIPENVVMVCKSCNSSKGKKRLYEWKGLKGRHSHNRIAEGKYLKYLFSLHEKNGTLDENDITKRCLICNMQKICEKENSTQKMSVYCIEGCFFSNNDS